MQQLSNNSIYKMLTGCLRYAVYSRFWRSVFSVFFFFKDPAPTEIPSFPLPAPLPIYQQIFAPRVHAPAPGIRRIPGPADLDGPIVFLHVEIAGAADDVLVLDADDDEGVLAALRLGVDRKSTRLNSSHSQISYAVFCLQ